MSIQWIETVFAIIGILISLYSTAVVILDRFGYYSWLGIKFRSKKLINEINESGYSPDIVVGLGRSGAVLGGILAGNLGVVPITVIDRDYDWIDDKTRAVVPILFVKEELLKGKKILLVDAAPHTGETSRVIKNELLKSSPADLKIASLFKHKYTVQVPDFYVNEVQKVRKMPWRFSEDYREDFASRRRR